MEERLQKVLSAAGVASRRKSEELIASGRVSIDGKVVTEPGVKADPEKQTIAVDGVAIRKLQRRYYILLNKPKGYTSTRSDPHAKHTVMELIEDVSVPLHPVGRLDVDTEGMLILTNDGDFTYALTHPSHQIPKTYVATVMGEVTRETLRKLEQGVQLEDGMTAPAKAQLIRMEQGNKVSVVELTITEGKKRQIRRMFSALRHRVLELKRMSIDGVALGNLRLGTWRHLSEAEVTRLLRGAGIRNKG